MNSLLRTACLAGALNLAGQALYAQPVTLEQAVHRALGGAPSVQAAEAGVAAARGARDQAHARPNPSVSIEGENLVGTGIYDALRQSEVTLGYNQPIERSAKREARVALAEREIDVSQANVRVARLDLAASVERAFIDVLITREAAKIAEEILALENEIEREALRRVRGYKDPLFVGTRARTRVLQAQLALAETRARLTRARNLLASYTGLPAETLDVDGALHRARPAAVPDELADLARDRAQVRRAQASVVVEETRRAQDITVSGGARYLRGTNDVALLAGVTIPLGRFDRNAGNIARVRAERQQLEYIAEANRLERLRRLAALGADAEAARARADGVFTKVFPQTVKTLEQVRAGYNRGGFSFADVEGAADTMIEAQQQWVEAMTRFRDLQSEIDRLSGRFDVAAVGESAR